MNTNKFSGKGSIYAKSRPSYPKELFCYLIDGGIISSETAVADIGSGTGIFSVELASVVNKVFAVEPNEDMRNYAEKAFSSLDNVISVDASAENTSLDAESVGCITAAQSFHWFDRALFKEECRRILKPDGYVVLVWNERDETAEIIKENLSVNRNLCSNFKGASNGFDYTNGYFEDFFVGKYEIKEFANDLIYDSDTFVLRNLSSSYAPKPSDENHDAYIAELKRVFDKFSYGGVVRYPYITRCFIGKV